MEEASAAWLSGIRHGPRRGRLRRAAALALLLLGSPVTARATTVLAKPFEALCAEADMIFSGTVSTVRSKWSDAGRSSIETLVTFDDLEMLKGEARERMTLRFAGGQVGEVRESIGGMPQFETGARVIVFAREGRAVSPIVGFHQGCFRATPAGQVETCAGQPLAGEGGGADGGAPVFLDAFVARVRRQLGTDRR